MAYRSPSGLYMADHVPGEEKEYKNPLKSGIKNIPHPKLQAMKANDQMGYGNELSIEETRSYMTDESMMPQNDSGKSTYETMDDTGTSWMVTDDEYAPPFEPDEVMAANSYRSAAQKRIDWAYQQGVQAAMRKIGAKSIEKDLEQDVDNLSSDLEDLEQRADAGNLSFADILDFFRKAEEYKNAFQKAIGDGGQSDQSFEAEIISSYKYMESAYRNKNIDAFLNEASGFVGHAQDSLIEIKDLNQNSKRSITRTKGGINDIWGAYQTFGAAIDELASMVNPTVSDASGVVDEAKTFLQQIQNYTGDKATLHQKTAEIIKSFNQNSKNLNDFIDDALSYWEEMGEIIENEQYSAHGMPAAASYQPRRKTFQTPYEALTKLYVNSGNGDLSSPDNQAIAEGLLIMLESSGLVEEPALEELVDCLALLADGDFLEVDPWRFVELAASAQGVYASQLRLLPPITQR